jgi:hypothetical protein
MPFALANIYAYTRQIIFWLSCVGFCCNGPAENPC